MDKRFLNIDGFINSAYLKGYYISHYYDCLAIEKDVVIDMGSTVHLNPHLVMTLICIEDKGKSFMYRADKKNTHTIEENRSIAFRDALSKMDIVLQNGTKGLSTNNPTLLP